MTIKTQAKRLVSVLDCDIASLEGYSRETRFKRYIKALMKSEEFKAYRGLSVYGGLQKGLNDCLRVAKELDYPERFLTPESMKVVLFKIAEYQVYRGIVWLLIAKHHTHSPNSLRDFDEYFHKHTIANFQATFNHEYINGHGQDFKAGEDFKEMIWRKSLLPENATLCLEHGLVSNTLDILSKIECYINYCDMNTVGSVDSFTYVTEYLKHTNKAFDYLFIDYKPEVD